MGAKLSDIGKIVQQAFTSKKILDAAGASLVESMQKRIRLGRGVEENLSDATNLPKLKTKTIENRKRFVEVSVEKKERKFLDKAKRFIQGKKINKKTIRKTKLDEMVDPKYFKPSKSNLTFTGDLVNSITYKVTDKQIHIFFNTENSKRKAQELMKLGFNFFHISLAEYKRAVKIMANEVKLIIEKIIFDKL